MLQNSINLTLSPSDALPSALPSPPLPPTCRLHLPLRPPPLLPPPAASLLLTLFIVAASTSSSSASAGDFPDPAFESPPPALRRSPTATPPPSHRRTSDPSASSSGAPRLVYARPPLAQVPSPIEAHSPPPPQPRISSQERARCSPPAALPFVVFPPSAYCDAGAEWLVYGELPINGRPAEALFGPLSSAFEASL
ncbi:uncharacterized protein A4U43_C05F34010 [Asparagus officinalis]|uniref:Uncharacterized protein n=1 Tax=Asparagus officinalis TaxID=4686 RepID=A0A5P1EWP5_ASPOF|nr:uncharacterized protein A4U43_C05F34010 [Asparagus officinalis]